MSQIALGAGPGRRPLILAPGASVQVTTGTTFKGFPGLAWLDSTRVALNYRHGASHLIGGNIDISIGTATNTNPWGFSWGTAWTAADVANDLRCEDAASVLSVGGVDKLVILAREYSVAAAVNLSPCVYISDDAATAVISGATFTRYNIALSGHTQDLSTGRVLRLNDGTYIAAVHAVSGASHSNGVAKVASITDWSAPTFVWLNASTTARDEICLEKIGYSGLVATIRNDTSTTIESYRSADFGTTWTGPTTLFSGSGFPAFRITQEGLGLIGYRKVSGSLTGLRQNSLPATDTNWTPEYTMDAAGSSNAYCTLLRLDSRNVLMAWARQSGEADPLTSNIYTAILSRTNG